jgi:hypothetical protein
VSLDELTRDFNAHSQRAASSGGGGGAGGGAYGLAAPPPHVTRAMLLEAARQLDGLLALDEATGTARRLRAPLGAAAGGQAPAVAVA